MYYIWKSNFQKFFLFILVFFLLAFTTIFECSFVFSFAILVYSIGEIKEERKNNRVLNVFTTDNRPIKPLMHIWMINDKHLHFYIEKLYGKRLNKRNIEKVSKEMDYMLYYFDNKEISKMIKEKKVIVDEDKNMYVTNLLIIDYYKEMQKKIVKLIDSKKYKDLRKQMASFDKNQEGYEELKEIEKKLDIIEKNRLLLDEFI